MEYDPFNDRLVFAATDSFEDSVDIFAVDLDGSNLTLLHTTELEQGVGGFYIIPTPGTLAVLGLAGAAAIRRRR